MAGRALSLWSPPGRAGPSGRGAPCAAPALRMPGRRDRPPQRPHLARAWDGDGPGWDEDGGGAGSVGRGAGAGTAADARQAALALAPGADPPWVRLVPSIDDVCEDAGWPARVRDWRLFWNAVRLWRRCVAVASWADLDRVPDDAELAWLRLLDAAGGLREARIAQARACPRARLPAAAHSRAAAPASGRALGVQRGRCRLCCSCCGGAARRARSCRPHRIVAAGRRACEPSAARGWQALDAVEARRGELAALGADPPAQIAPPLPWLPPLPPADKRPHERFDEDVEAAMASAELRAAWPELLPELLQRFPGVMAALFPDEDERAAAAAAGDLAELGPPLLRAQAEHLWERSLRLNALLEAVELRRAQRAALPMNRLRAEVAARAAAVLKQADEGAADEARQLPRWQRDEEEAAEEAPLAGYVLGGEGPGGPDAGEPWDHWDEWTWRAYMEKRAARELRHAEYRWDQARPRSRRNPAGA